MAVEISTSTYVIIKQLYETQNAQNTGVQWQISVTLEPNCQKVYCQTEWGKPSNIWNIYICTSNIGIYHRDVTDVIFTVRWYDIVTFIIISSCTLLRCMSIGIEGIDFKWKTTLFNLNVLNDYN